MTNNQEIDKLILRLGCLAIFLYLLHFIIYFPYFTFFSLFGYLGVTFYIYGEFRIKGKKGRLFIISMFSLLPFFALILKSNLISKFNLNHSDYEISFKTTFFLGIIALFFGALSVIFELFFIQKLRIRQIFKIFKEARLNSKETTDTSIVLGKTEKGLDFKLTEKNLVLHTDIIGGTGFGKTNLIKNILENRIKYNKSVIFVDLKAEYEMNTWLAGCAQKYGRLDDLELLSTNFPASSINYNPVKNGDMNEIKSKIMSCFEWSEPFYKKSCSFTLGYICDFLCRIRDNHQFEFDLFDIYNLLINKNNFLNLEKKYQIYSNNINEKNEFLENVYSDEAQKNIKGLKADLYYLIKSKLGNNLKKNSKGREIKDLISSNKILYIQMNTMQDRESSEAIGKIFLQDLITTVGNSFSEISSNNNLNCLTLIDEFGSLGIESFIDLLNRSRGVGLGLMVAYQSPGDLEKISEHFSKRLDSNTNNKIFFGTKSPLDSEKFSGMLGTKKSKKETKTTVKNFIGSSEGERGSVRETEEFNVHPNIFKNLGRGEGVCIKSVVDTDWGVVKFNKANEYHFVQDLKKAHEISDDSFSNDAITKPDIDF